MKKAKCAIVTCEDNTIYDFKILTAKGDFIRLEMCTRQWDSQKKMLNHIIAYANANGYEIASKKMFNATFYNIALIDRKDGYISDTLSF